MNSFELTSAVTAIANAIAFNLSVNEITLLAAVLVQLGDTLSTIATSKSICLEPEEKQNAGEVS